MTSPADRMKALRTRARLAIHDSGQLAGLSDAGLLEAIGEASRRALPRAIAEIAGLLVTRASERAPPDCAICIAYIGVDALADLHGHGRDWIPIPREIVTVTPDSEPVTVTPDSELVTPEPVTVTPIRDSDALLDTTNIADAFTLPQSASMPLSDRDAAILALHAAGVPLRQIAAQFGYKSDNSIRYVIKRHTKSPPPPTDQP